MEAKSVKNAGSNGEAMTRVTRKYARLIAGVPARKRRVGLRCCYRRWLLLSASCFKFHLDIIRRRSSDVTSPPPLPVP